MVEWSVVAMVGLLVAESVVMKAVMKVCWWVDSMADLKVAMKAELKVVMKAEQMVEWWAEMMVVQMVALMAAMKELMKVELMADLTVEK